jgi:hypothetical protein
MNLILVVCLLTPPLKLMMPNFSGQHHDLSSSVMLIDYGLTAEKPKKNALRNLPWRSQRR